MLIYIIVFFGGLAALTWEILWLHFTALAIGVSAQAAAIVLSAMMLGMAAGSLAGAPLLRHLEWRPSTKHLALLEALIGLLGIFIAPCFAGVERLDGWIFHTAPGLAPVVQALGIVAVLGMPAFFMGATMPVYARIAEQFRMAVSGFYATNVAGASVGILAASFLFIPAWGIDATVKLTAGLNILAALLALAVRAPGEKAEAADTEAEPVPELTRYSLERSLGVVFCAGLAAFALEVIWFRCLRAALCATTESFAMMLFATLIALAVGGYISYHVRRLGRFSLAFFLALAAFLVLETIPLVEGLDITALPPAKSYLMFQLLQFMLVLEILFPPMCVLGIALPWLLDIHNKSGKVGRLYAVNTFGAVLGSLAAAWLLLPHLGVTKSGWLVGGVLLAASLILSRPKEIIFVVLLGGAGLFIAVTHQTGLGVLHIEGVPSAMQYTVLESREGPDATTSVIELPDKLRHLFIDGFSASNEKRSAHYMDWMGRLPMLLAKEPNKALVICFGTGQTANGVRQEDPQILDIVDVNPAVFDMAHYFHSNQRVLQDPRAHRFVMDGRAFLRRTKRLYDVVTLEPMPPTFAGSNALYSREFYQLIYGRLNDGGVATQWLPFHLVDPQQSASIVATFLDVFSDAFLWIDPVSHHGILMGFKRKGGESQPLAWYGLQRGPKRRNLSDDEIRNSEMFGEKTLKKFARKGRLITDDNQYLSYGFGRMKWMRGGQYRQRQDVTLNILRSL